MKTADRDLLAKDGGQLSNKPQSDRITHLALLGLGILWGVNCVVVKFTLAEINPLAFNALRFSMASVMTMLLTWVSQGRPRIPRRDWLSISLLGLFGNFLFQTIYINGVARTKAGNVSLIFSSTPVFVALVGRLLGTEVLHRRNWAGILLSFAGIFLVVVASGEGFGIAPETLLGDLLVLCATAIWALHTVLCRRVIDRNGVLQTTAWMMVAGTPLMILVALPQLRAQHWSAISTGSWLGLAYSALLGVGIGQVIWNSGVRRLGSARTAIYSYLQPLVALVIAWALLEEKIGVVQVLGGACVILGVELGRRREQN